MADVLRVLEVDLLDADQGEIALAFARGADGAVDGVAGAQAELTDLRGADIDVIGAGQVVGFRAAKIAEAVLDHFQGAGTGDGDAFLGQSLEDREHHVLLAHGVGVLDLQRLGEGEQVGGRLVLQLLERHPGQAHGGDGRGDLGGFVVFVSLGAGVELGGLQDDFLGFGGFDGRIFGGDVGGGVFSHEITLR